MSYLDNRESQFIWVARPELTSLRIDPGCVQCGSQLQLDEHGKPNHSGKCFNCFGWSFDEDEVFDELED